MQRTKARHIWLVWVAALLLSAAALWLVAPESGSSAAAQDLAPTQGLTAVLTKTVGTQPGVCGTATTLSVSPGTTVYYCYTLRNTGTIAIDPQDLLDGLPNNPDRVNWVKTGLLEPGATLTPTAENGLIRAAVISQSEAVAYATWGLVAADSSATLQVQSNPTTVNATTLSIQPILTVGTAISPCPTTLTVVLASYLNRAYLCVTIVNASSVSLTNNLISVPALGVNNVAVTTTVGAIGASNATVAITAQQAPALGVFLTAPSITARAFVTSTAFGSGQAVSGVSEPVTVNGPAPSITVAKYVNSDPSACSLSTTLNASIGQQFYYCLVVSNSQSLTYTLHQFNEPALRIAGAFNATLAPGGRITLTNATLPVFGVGPVLGPFTVEQSINNNMYYTATNPAFNISASAVVGAAITAPTRTPTPTQQATATDTPIPGPSPTPTWTLTPIPPSPTPSPTWTTTPTPTPSPTMLVFSTPGGQVATPYPSLLAGSQPQATPIPANAFTSPLDPAAAATATAIAALQFGFPTPIIDPVGATATAIAAQQFGFPTPIIDPVGATATAIAAQQFGFPTPIIDPAGATATAVAAQQFGFPTPVLDPIGATATANAQFGFPTPIIDPVGATATAMAMLGQVPSPLEPPDIQSPALQSPTPAQVAAIPAPQVITVTATPTAGPTPGPTQRPIEAPTPGPGTDGRSLLLRTLDSAGMTLALLWFLGGSVIFFLTAGVLAGLSFRSKERDRYQLREEDSPQYRAEPAPPPPDDTPWPDSLP